MFRRLAERSQAGATQPLLDLKPVLPVRVDVLIAGRRKSGDVLVVHLLALRPEPFDHRRIMASLAQMERELLAEWTRAGLDAARRRGRVGGRKRQMTPGKVESARKLLKGGMSPRDVAENLGVSIPTLYRWVPASSQ